MNTIRRLAAAGALTALALTLTACGGSDTPSTAMPPAATPTSATAPADDRPAAGAEPFGPACNQLPQGDAPGSLNAMGPQPVASAASTNPLLTTLVSAVKAADLVQTLNQQPAITVFAPYDPAFAQVKAKLGDQKFNALLQDKTALGGVLKYHVVADRRDRADLAAAGSVAPLAGGSLQIKDTADGMTVTDGAGNTAKVLCGNIPTANATVFVIDKVLMPQS